MTLKMAFAGFRHGHILDLYTRAQTSDRIEVVAACEEDEPTRRELAAGGKVSITHTDYQAVLDGVECDVVAVGDYYSRRGGIIIEALRRGKHVISDKPLCTSVEEMREIQSLAAATGLRVGCQLDLRDLRQYITLRELVRNGAVGEVHGIIVTGHHPLMLGVRPNWYFEEGKHGGTINDIGIHAFDIVEWLTGARLNRIMSARSWNAFARDFPHFHDAAQFMLEMDNGCGVLGDVSYFSPDKKGYSLEQYWRIALYGREGMAETSVNMPHVTLARNTEGEVERIPALADDPGGYLNAFLADVSGEPLPDALTTSRVIRAGLIAVMAQQAGVTGEPGVIIPD